MALDTVSVNTPSLAIGEDDIYISTITPSMVVVGSISISGLSGGTQPSAPFTSAYPFGMPSSGIPLVSSTLPAFDFISMTLMAIGFSSLQDFVCGSGCVPPSNP